MARLLFHRDLDHECRMALGRQVKDLPGCVAEVVQLAPGREVLW